MVRLTASKAGNVATMLDTSKINCRADNAVADSINASAMDRILLPPRKNFSYKEGSSRQYTLTILNRIKLVTTAFTAKDAP